MAIQDFHRGNTRRYRFFFRKNTGTVEIKRSGTNIVVGDIGSIIRHEEGDKGTLEAVDGEYLTIRPSSTDATDSFAHTNGSLTCNGHVDTQTDEAAAIWQAIDITDWIIILTFKTEDTDVDPGLLQITTTAGDDPLDDAVNGIMYVVLPSDDSANLPVGTIHYGFKRIIPGTPPDVLTLDKDKVKIFQNITDKVTV